METLNTQRRDLRVLTIGHSNHPLEHFVHLLRLHAVDVVVDTRSYPYSNFAMQYDQEPLRAALRAAKFQYIYLGKELGGRPDGEQFYDAEGHVFYDRVADADFFKAGIARVEEGIRKYKVALLCAEENPTGCHRRLLIGQVLLENGVSVEHIRGDGQLQSESELVNQINALHPQMDLFNEIEARGLGTTMNEHFSGHALAKN